MGNLDRVIVTDKKKTRLKPTCPRLLSKRFLIYSFLIALIPALLVYFNAMLYLSSISTFLFNVSKQIRMILKDGVPLNQSQLSLDKVVDSFSRVAHRTDHIVDYIQWSSLIMIGCLILGILIVAMVIVLKKRRLLSDLQKALLQIEQANYSKRIYTKRQDEIGQFIQTLNQLFEYMEKKDGLFMQLLQKDLFESNLPKTSHFKLVSPKQDGLENRMYFSCIPLALGQFAFIVVYPLEGSISNHLGLFVRNYVHLFFQTQFVKCIDLTTFMDQLRAKLACLSSKEYQLSIEMVCGVIDFNLYKINFINCGVKSLVYFNKSENSIQVFKSSKNIIDDDILDFVEESVRMNLGDRLLFYRGPLSFKMGTKGYHIYSSAGPIHEYTNLQNFFNQMATDIFNDKHGQYAYLFELN